MSQGLTTDRDDEGLKKTRPDGQQEKYLILSAEERAKGFIRPLRHSYIHIGNKPKYPLRDLTQEEHERYDKFGYIKYEEYPEGSPERANSSVVGKFYTEKTLKSGCGTKTNMSLELCETYARDPKFYGATFCACCGIHLPVGEFIWSEDNEVVGS